MRGCYIRLHSKKEARKLVVESEIFWKIISLAILQNKSMINTIRIYDKNYRQHRWHLMTFYLKWKYILSQVGTSTLQVWVYLTKYDTPLCMLSVHLQTECQILLAIWKIFQACTVLSYELHLLFLTKQVREHESHVNSE